MDATSDTNRLPNFRTADELAAEAAAEAQAQNPFISQWRPRTIGDALQPRPPAMFFVDRVLREGSLTIIFGAPGSLKSMIVMDMLASIAAGVPWLQTMPDNGAEQEPFPTSHVPCLWLDYDNGEDLTDERFEAFARTYNLAPDAPLTYYSLPIPWLDLSHRDHALHFMGLIQHSGARVVVIDNLGLIKGGASENTDEMQPVMSHLREIANTTRCAIVLIHHQRKAGTNGGEGGPRKGETLRGYSGIEAACDLILHVDRPEKQDYVLVTPTKVRRRAPFDTIGAIFTYRNNDMEELQQARFWAWPVDDAKTALGKQVMATIRDQVHAHPLCNQGKLVQHVQDWFVTAGKPKPGVNLVRGYIKQLVEDGELAERRGAKAANREEITYSIR
jgi:hypothetical protein